MSDPFLLKKRTVKLRGRLTSVWVEEPFWDGIKLIAQHNKTSLQTVIERIDERRISANLSSAVRVFVLNYYRERSKPADPSAADPPAV